MMFDLRPGQGGSHRAKFNCGSKGSEMVRAGVFQEDVGLLVILKGKQSKCVELIL